MSYLAARRSLATRDSVGLWAGRQVALTAGVRSFLAGPVVIASAMAGCFYGPPVNERPSAEIQRLATSDLRRGGHLDLTAQVVDADLDAVTLAWKVFGCDAGGLRCDDAPLVEGAQAELTVAIPASKLDGAPVAALRVELDVTDQWGAHASPPQVLVVDVANAAPTVELQVRGLVDPALHTVGLPSWFDVRIGDVDDEPGAVAVAWQLEPPRDAPAGSWVFDDPGDPSSGDPAYRVEERRLVTATPGTWTVRVEATDALGATASVALGIAVLADAPPCLTTLAPVLPPDDAALPLDGPRRLEVSVVDDDTAPWPAPTDPYRDPATFRWALASPATAGVLTPLPDVTGNALELDPGAFAPGDLVEVRVEVDDGEARVLPCAPESPSCSIASDACFQRRTWRLEVP